jgi:hypothetical protein
VLGPLFDIYEGTEGETFEEGWRNKLIWGDNLYVMSSLLERVMHSGENRIEMRIPRSGWLLHDLCFPHS